MARGIADGGLAVAAREQSPAVARKFLHDLQPDAVVAHYERYGACLLTVERGKIVLAAFGYGAKLLPRLPRALIDGTRPSRPAWLLKERMLSPPNWKSMLRGRQWLARPELVD